MPGPVVLHLTVAYVPWIIGGKEIYAQSLIRELHQLDWQNHVLFHQNLHILEPLGTQDVEQATVHVIQPLPKAERIDYYNLELPVPGFQEALHQIKPDIVHFHDFSIAANRTHMEVIKQTGIPIVMTQHSPGQSCLQRELLFGGSTVCDGEIQINRCTECRLMTQGIPAMIRKPLSLVSLPVLGNSKLSRAFSAREMTRQYYHAWHSMVSQIDAMHVLSRWQMEVMKRNRVPTEKLAHISTGLPLTSREPPQRHERKPNDPLRIIMLGRCDDVKGQEVLIDAIKLLPDDAAVEVTFFGPYWDSPYGARCLSKITGDPRFQPPRLLPHKEIFEHMLSADLMAVPSKWLETGPLVVLEAFSAKLPVIGSNRGGIAELVKDGETGLLFETGNSQELARLLKRCIDESDLVPSLQRNIPPPRNMSDVAGETAELYRKLIERRNG
jgi:glycosyltransferase involved in cell wall biosynthesis